MAYFYENMTEYHPGIVTKRESKINFDSFSFLRNEKYSSISFLVQKINESLFLLFGFRLKIRTRWSIVIRKQLVSCFHSQLNNNQLA